MRPHPRPSFRPADRRSPLAVGLALVLGSSPAPFAIADAAHPWPESVFESASNGAAIRPLQGHPGTAVPLRPAGTTVVANCNDAGSGSLREALSQAVSGDVIDLTQLDCSSITLTSGSLTASADDLTLTGPGATQLAIDGGNSNRILAHAGYGTLTLDGLTLRNGAYVYAGPDIYGGLAAGACVLANHDATIIHASLEHCSASGKSVHGGALYVRGLLNLTDSTISGTTATAAASDISATIYGGAVYASAAYVTRSAIRDVVVSASSTTAFSGLLGGGVFGADGVVLTDSQVTGVVAHVSAAKDAYAKGGGVASPRTVILSGSTIADNAVTGTPGIGASGSYVYTSAIGGGGVYIASVPRGVPPASTITNSTISNNSALCDGVPGAYTVGGGGGLVSWSPVPVTIVNSTLSGNRTDLVGGAVYTRHLGSVSLSNATVTANSARNGGAIADMDGESPSGILSVSSIIAGNPSNDPVAPVDILSTHPVDGLANLIAAANVALPPDTIGGDPKLGPLADNGGPTLTHAPLEGSPAIDAGSNPGDLASDQRGDGYVRTVGSAPDIGAVERQAGTDTIFANGFD